MAAILLLLLLSKRDSYFQDTDQLQPTKSQRTKIIGNSFSKTLAHESLEMHFIGWC